LCYKDFMIFQEIIEAIILNVFVINSFINIWKKIT
jgi:hypothetical protein